MESHRLPQACQPVFEQVIGCAVPYELYHCFIFETTSDDDERNVQSRVLQKMKRTQSIELRKAVVRDNNVERGVQVG